MSLCHRCAGRRGRRRRTHITHVRHHSRRARRREQHLQPCRRHEPPAAAAATSDQDPRRTRDWRPRGWHPRRHPRLEIRHFCDVVARTVYGHAQTSQCGAQWERDGSRPAASRTSVHVPTRTRVTSPSAPQRARTPGPPGPHATHIQCSLLCATAASGKAMKAALPLMPCCLLPAPAPALMRHGSGQCMSLGRWDMRTSHGPTGSRTIRIRTSVRGVGNQMAPSTRRAPSMRAARRKWFGPTTHNSQNTVHDFLTNFGSRLRTHTRLTNFASTTCTS